MTNGGLMRSCLPWLQLLILKILKERGPLCGFRIAKILKEEIGINVEDAAVYTALSKLKSQGYVIATKEGRRVRYMINPDGLRFLNEGLKSLEKIQQAFV